MKKTGRKFKRGVNQVSVFAESMFARGAQYERRRWRRAFWSAVLIGGAAAWAAGEWLL